MFSSAGQRTVGASHLKLQQQVQRRVTLGDNATALSTVPLTEAIYFASQSRRVWRAKPTNRPKKNNNKKKTRVPKIDASQSELKGAAVALVELLPS